MLMRARFALAYFSNVASNKTLHHTNMLRSNNWKKIELKKAECKHEEMDERIQ